MTGEAAYIDDGSLIPPLLQSEGRRMKVTIFYSWQSDLPNGTNWDFIQRAFRDFVQH